MAALMTFSVAGCAPDAPTPPKGVMLPDYEKNTQQIVLGGWNSPNVSDEQFRMIQECGVNMLFVQGAVFAHSCSNTDLVKEALAYCDKYNIDAYVQKGTSITFSTAYDYYDKYFKEYESFRGFLVKDEPRLEQIDELADSVIGYNQRMGEKEYFVNLFPSYAPNMKDYKAYLEKYASSVLDKTSGEKWLSMDHYALTYNTKGEKDLAPNWLSDIEYTAEVGKAHGAKTHFFIQSMPFSFNGTAAGSRDRTPTLADFRLQMYTYLAFGAAGMTHFCYGTPPVNDIEFNESHLALVDREGKKTELYDLAKKVNFELLKFGKAYSSFEWQGVYPVIGSQTLTTRSSDIRNIRSPLDLSDLYEFSEITSTRDTLVGSFIDEESNNGYILVNYGETTKSIVSDVSLKCKTANTVRVYQKGEMQEVAVKDGEVKISLEPGEGVFIIPYVKG